MNAPSAAIFRRRREALVQRMAELGGDDAVAVFPAATVVPRENHTPLHGYRPDPDVYYLTGFAEPRCVVVVTKEKLTLFVQPRQRDREIFEGPSAGVEGARAQVGADEVFAIGELDAQMPKLLANRRRLFYRTGKDRAFDDKMLGFLIQGRAARRVSTRWPSEIVDSALLVHELRLFKDDAEVAALRESARITALAHRRAMAAASPGTHEYEIEALVFEAIRRTGNVPAYGIVAASGPNTCIIQYAANRRRMEDGELVILDAACLVDQIGCDVTRTFPVNGTFSRAQREIYDVVLAAHLAALEIVRPGVTLEQLHQKHAEVLTAGLVRVGVLSGEPRALLEQEAHKRFSWHRTTHWLGMDPLDVGAYFDDDGRHRPLMPGMLVSMEPAFYTDPADASVPAAWRGICVRIEDNVLVTKDGREVLTEAVPRTPDEIERACRPS